jgi:hypothetical protein
LTEKLSFFKENPPQPKVGPLFIKFAFTALYQTYGSNKQYKNNGLSAPTVLLFFSSFLSTSLTAFVILPPVCHIL